MTIRLPMNLWRSGSHPSRFLSNLAACRALPLSPRSADQMNFRGSECKQCLSRLARKVACICQIPRPHYRRLICPPSKVADREPMRASPLAQTARLGSLGYRPAWGVSPNMINCLVLTGIAQEIGSSCDQRIIHKAGKT